MFLPLGPVGERVRPPVVTIVLIVLNVLVHFATHDRVQADDRLLAKPYVELARITQAIELEHRGRAGWIRGALGLEGSSPAGSERFWWRWENGLIVPRDHPQWIAWREAWDAFDEARHRTLHYRCGWKRDDPSVASFLAHGFLHADFDHLFWNMLFLWCVGCAVEDAWGRKWFTILYAAGLVGAVLADFIWVKPGLDIPGIGASGAIAAVMGAMAVRHFRTPMRIASLVPLPGVYRIATGWLLIPWIAQQLVASAAKDAHLAGVGFGAHIGGFAVGAAVAGLLRLTRIESRDLAPAREAERRRQGREKHLALADERFRRGDTTAALDELRRALEFEPDDLALRFRLVEALGMLLRRDEQLSEGLELLQRLWKAGQRERFAATHEWLQARCGPLPPALAHRAAPVLEPADPAAAARNYVVALQQAPDDPLASQSFKRYAELLDRLGEAQAAARVRELGAAHERRKRDRGLG